MTASPMNMVMTIIGFAVSFMFMVFVCTRLVCARIQLNASWRSIPPSRSDLSLLERGLHGLEPLYVASFATNKYSVDLFPASADPLCTVCLGEYQVEEMLRILPYCGHSFHVLCIDKWLQLHSTCPICRISLREFPDKKMQRAMPPLFSSAIRISNSGQLQDSNQRGAPSVIESGEDDNESREEHERRKQATSKSIESPSS